LIVAVVGTGTGVGKTTLSVAMIELLREGALVGAWKPIETGGDADGRALAEASGCDAGPAIVLRAPLAPSVSARLEGVAIDLESLASAGRERAKGVDVLIVELPGGLYSPLDVNGRTNSELLRELGVERVVLVAANRLGVLHDVEVCRRAMRADGLRLDLIVLTGAPEDDRSVESNAAELGTAVAVVEVRSPGDTAQLADWLSQCFTFHTPASTRPSRTRQR
jgi:dethiobiotin synthetase